MAYEFVRVEKTPTLQQMKVSHCLERSRLAPLRSGAVNKLKGGTYSFEFSNCARTAMVGENLWRSRSVLDFSLSLSFLMSLSLQVRGQVSGCKGSTGWLDHFGGNSLMSSAGFAGEKTSVKRSEGKT